LEEDLERLLEDSKQKTPVHVTETSLQKKKSKISFKKTSRKKKQSRNTFSNIDDIDEKIEHCLQKAEDTFDINTSLEEFSNQWTPNSRRIGRNNFRRRTS